MNILKKRRRNKTMATFVSGPTLVYLAVGSMHILQQLLRNEALKSERGVPETDYIFQALVMACISEVLCQHNLSGVAWMLAAPAIVVSIGIVFYSVMIHCSL
jgi:hypothetical protein